MAYTPTVWETGDVITAEKLNKAENGIAAASVAELPSVEAADQGKVLTVDSSGEWDAANLPANKDVLVLEGTVVADASLTPQSFTLTSGDVADIATYKMSLLKVTVKISTADFMIAYLPLQRRAIMSTLMQAENRYIFETIASLHKAATTLSCMFFSVFYDIDEEAWHTDIYPVTLTLTT